MAPADRRRRDVGDADRHQGDQEQRGRHQAGGGVVEGLDAVVDGDGDGLLEGAQYNTLDQAWYGPMGWISSLYLGALTAGSAMASDMGDLAFVERCRTISSATS